jgi:hypothetical protein
MMHTFTQLWLKGLALSSVAFLLGGVFTLYRQPDFLVNLANQAWGCL